MYWRYSDKEEWFSSFIVVEKKTSVQIDKNVLWFASIIFLMYYEKDIYAFIIYA
jgi:hypothetical protein